MKQKPILLLMILIVWVGYGFNLSAKISSRIGGIVIDRSTKEPIKNAMIVLYKNDEKFKVIESNEKGKFEFNLYVNNPGEDVFFLNCEVSGYTPLIPKYFLYNTKNEFEQEIFQYFSIEPGQIKYITLEMKKEATIKGVIYKKEAAGTLLFEEVDVFLIRNSEILLRNKNIFQHTKTDENGQFIFFNLEPFDDSSIGDYTLKFKKNGILIPKIGNIKILSGSEYIVKHTVDLSEPYNIQGVVRIEGSKLVEGSIYLDSPSTYMPGLIFDFDETDETGKFFFHGLKSGTYTLNLSALSEGGEEIGAEKVVNVTKGKTQTVNFDLKLEL